MIKLCKDIMLQYLLMELLVLVKLIRNLVKFKLNIIRMMGTDSNPGIMFLAMRELFNKIS